MSCNFAFAANWVEISKKVYADTNSIKIDYERQEVSYWLKMEPPSDFEEYNGQKIYEMKALYITNCKNHTFSSSAGYFFDKQGKYITGSSYSPLEFRAIIPGTLTEITDKLMCSMINKNVKMEK